MERLGRSQKTGWVRHWDVWCFRLSSDCYDLVLSEETTTLMKTDGHSTLIRMDAVAELSAKYLKSCAG